MRGGRCEKSGRGEQKEGGEVKSCTLSKESSRG